MSIDVRVIDPDDLLLAERDENEVRKDFTPSERVAIAKTIANRIGNRHGQRTDLVESPTELVGDCPQVDQGVKTRDIAAKAAGFEDSTTYRRAAKVVANGCPGLVEAMDQGEVSISAAAEVALLPESEQAAVVADGPEFEGSSVCRSRPMTAGTSNDRNGHPGWQCLYPILGIKDPSQGKHVCYTHSTRRSARSLRSWEGRKPLAGTPVSSSLTFFSIISHCSSDIKKPSVDGKRGCYTHA